MHAQRASGHGAQWRRLYIPSGTFVRSLHGAGSLYFPGAALPAARAPLAGTDRTAAPVLGTAASGAHRRRVYSPSGTSRHSLHAVPNSTGTGTATAAPRWHRCRCLCTPSGTSAHSLHAVGNSSGTRGAGPQGRGPAPLHTFRDAAPFLARLAGMATGIGAPFLARAENSLPTGMAA